MQTTTIKPHKSYQGLKEVLATNQVTRIEAGINIVPHAGQGACKLCSCQKFVRGDGHRQGSLSNMQPVPCDNCGHDIRSHA